MKNLLVVGVIGLFLGLTCAPSINADVEKESDLVEITTEICGLSGGKQTVQLTQEEAEEVEKLIDDIKRRLDRVKTREEAVEISTQAVGDLKKYGLISEDMNIDNIWNIYNKASYLADIKRIDSNLFRERLNNHGWQQNEFCFVFGYVTYSLLYTIPWWFGAILINLADSWYVGDPFYYFDDYVRNFGLLIQNWSLNIRSYYLFPFGIIPFMMIETEGDDPREWMYSIGREGVVTWKSVGGGFYGELIGFIGVRIVMRIHDIDGLKAKELFYLGFALYINVFQHEFNP